MNEQKKNINCRVCLRYDLKKSQKCFSLFENYNNSLISDKIKYIANVEITKGDGLPSKICPDCLLQLETAIVFKQKCVTSNKILHNIQPKPSKICKLTLSVPVKKEVEVVFEDNADDHNADFSDTELDTIKPEISRNTQHENVVDRVPKNIELQDQEPEDITEKLVKKSKAIDLKLICDDCGGSFKSKCKIAVHWKKVHLPVKLTCPRCKRMFKSFKAFQVHEKNKSRSCHTATKVRIEGQGKNRIFHCHDCTYHTKHIKDMDAHLVTHSGDRRFQCKDCFKCFTQHSSLQGHRESSHNDYRVETTCHYCGKLIKGRCRYYKHLMTHKPKNSKCEVCKKMFKNRATLANHMIRHSGAKSFTCEICPANFYTTSELCNHRKKVHFKLKTFKCDMCEYSSYTAALLQKHKSNHSQNNVVCLMCGKFMENAEKLVIHQKKHTEKNFPCPNCDKGFYRRYSLRRHIMKTHAAKNKEHTDKEKVVNIKQECPADNKFNDMLHVSPTKFI